jgi:hypothetical protein
VLAEIRRTDKKSKNGESHSQVPSHGHCKTLNIHAKNRKREVVFEFTREMGNCKYPQTKFRRTQFHVESKMEPSVGLNSLLKHPPARSERIF